MKHITRYYKRLNIKKLKIAILAVIVSAFFLPSYVAFEKTGNNMFKVILNDVEVGMVGDESEAREYVLEARRRIAKDSQELVLVKADLVTEGEEVLYGKVDEPDSVVERMVSVLSGDVVETLHRSYVVKVNEYMVNLADKADVLKLLQAALDKYDNEGNYQVELHPDPARELTVLTTQISTKEEALLEAQETLSMEAGIHADIFFLSQHT